MRPRTVGLELIGIYRALSPHLRAFLNLPSECRMVPSCSEYAEGAILRHGVWRGSRAAIGRLLRCHPWHSGGYDPVP